MVSNNIKKKKKVEKFPTSALLSYSASKIFLSLTCSFKWTELNSVIYWHCYFYALKEGNCSCVCKKYIILTCVEVKFSLGHETRLNHCLFLMHMCVIDFRLHLKLGCLFITFIPSCCVECSPQGCQSLFNVILKPELADQAVWSVVKVMVAAKRGFVPEFLQTFLLAILWFLRSPEFQQINSFAVQRAYYEYSFPAIPSYSTQTWGSFHFSLKCWACWNARIFNSGTEFSY